MPSGGLIKKVCLRGHELSLENRENNGRCRLCRKHRHSLYYAVPKNKERANVNAKIWYARKRDCPFYRWDMYIRHLRLKYKLTEKQYLEMLWKSKGRCYNKNCNFPDPAICVDHNHFTGAVRGLLCQHCNKALGTLFDNPQKLIGLANYLKYE